MRWPGLGWLIPLVAVVLLSGCGGSGRVVVTTTVVSPRLVSAVIHTISRMPTAGVCGFKRGPIVTVYVGDGTPEPRCVRVRADQMVRVINRAGPTGPPEGTVTVTWPPFGRRRLTAGGTIVFNQSVGLYLAPGDHKLGISRYGRGGAEIVLVEAARNVAAAECRGSALSVRLIHGGEAGPIAGGYLSFTNRGNRRCALSGWPPVRGVQASGTSSVAQNVDTTQFGPNVSEIPTVVLNPGGHADAVVVGGTEPGPGRSTCGKPYTRLVVAAPGSREHEVMSTAISGLYANLPSCAGIDVSMIVPSTSLYRG